MTIRAIGFSHSSDFDPHDPGRLCRGRERWITPWKAEDADEEQAELSRLVVTGASFDDDSARDAMRGLAAAEVDATDLIARLFPGRRLLVFTEDGHPADIPEAAEGIELYDGFRAGGKVRLPCVRWHMLVETEEALRALSHDILEERIRGFAVIDKKTDIEALWNALFLVVGMGNMDSPPAKYNPAGFLTALEYCDALVVLHRDKHGPVVGVYAKQPPEDHEARLQAVADAAGILLVPFAIPPMLARWDRALYELRQTWEAEKEEPFPVPRSDQPSHWEARRSRRRRDRERRKSNEDDDSSEE